MNDSDPADTQPSTVYLSKNLFKLNLFSFYAENISSTVWKLAFEQRPNLQCGDSVEESYFLTTGTINT